MINQNHIEVDYEKMHDKEGGLMGQSLLVTDIAGMIPLSSSHWLSCK